MNEPVLDGGPSAEAAGDFAGFLRSAGLLAVAKQVSALCFLGAVFVLPALTSRSVATDFVWAYFAMLTLTSLFGVGLERLSGMVAASRGDLVLGHALAPVLLLRLVTLPAVAAGLWALLWFVGVSLPASAWWATMVWIVAGLLTPILFSGLRAVGNSTIEPKAMVAARVSQGIALVALAASGMPVAAMVAVVGGLEWLAVLTAVRAVGSLGPAREAWARVRRLPVRQGFALAGSEVVGIANLRADLLLVGHLLGPGAGATYGLLYRAVDGFNGAAGSAGLWLYAESVNVRDGGTDPRGLRARSLALFPRIGLGIALVVIVTAGAAGALVPRLASETDTLRILVTAFPILCVNMVETHVRSGRGRNRELLGIQCAILAFTVPVSVGFILAFGLPGAAGAFLLSELCFTGLLWRSAERDERRLMGPAVVTAVGGGILLLGAGVALGAGRIGLALPALLTVIALVAGRIVRPRPAGTGDRGSGDAQLRTPSAFRSASSRISPAQVRQASGE